MRSIVLYRAACLFEQYVLSEVVALSLGHHGGQFALQRSN